ncbi:MAG: hypothetical protein ACREHV_12950, partial [Rhizomicrobium sp.]
HTQYQSGDNYLQSKDALHSDLLARSTRVSPPMSVVPRESEVMSDCAWTLKQSSKTRAIQKPQEIAASYCAIGNLFKPFFVKTGVLRSSNANRMRSASMKAGYGLAISALRRRPAKPAVPDFAWAQSLLSITAARVG